jgi:hypothetical protein
VRVTNAQAQGDGVAVTFEHAGKIEEAAFRYVIGCDGAHSVIRSAAGIGFPGEPMPYDFMLGDVHVDLGLPRGLGLRLIRPKPNTPPDILVVVPLPEWNRYRITLFAPPELRKEEGSDHGIQSERANPTLPQLQAELDRVAPGRGALADLRWSSIFRISTRLADHYRAGSFFLAGDAAHIHPPTGGQGMNTGIQDAYNLAWKMALVLKGAAKPGLLDSYEPERRTEGLNVLARTTAATQGIAQRGPEDRLADTQILVAYAASAWIRDDADNALFPNTPAPGQRAPDCRGLRRAGVGFPLRLFEVLRGTEHVLLVDARETTPDQLATLGGMSRQVRVVAIGSRLADTAPGLTWLVDAGGDFSNTYVSRAGAAWLVRPDGYISWRGAGDFSTKLTDYLGAIFRSS